MTNINTDKMAPQNMKITNGNNQVTQLLDSGSACSIVTKDLAPSILDNRKEAKCLTEQIQIFKNVSNEPVKTEGTVLLPVKCNNWSTSKSTIPTNYRRNIKKSKNTYKNAIQSGKGLTNTVRARTN